MKHLAFRLVCLLALLPGTDRACAASITLQFDELSDGEAPSLFYSGGSGSLGTGPGPSTGIRFIGGVANISAVLGGSGRFDAPPSNATALFADNIVTVEVPEGFIGSVAFWYQASQDAVTVRILGHAGESLRLVNLGPTGPPQGGNAYSPFVWVELPFQGEAKTLSFAARGSNGVYLDDLSIESVADRVVPEPSSLLYSCAGFVVLLVCSDAHSIGKRST